MIRRLCNPFRSSSFFLFGARATGKTTFLRSFFSDQSAYWIDLLDPGLEARYLRDPGLFFKEIVTSLPVGQWVVVDEIQKCPLLLNYVHKLIEERGIQFALTGSSARKLRRGAANLLAGRALWNDLYPLTAAELGPDFELSRALNWGTLPALLKCSTDEERAAYLQAYAHTYLKEEVFAEQLVRGMQPFRRFLEVAAQCHGTRLNYRKLGRELGIDGKTIHNYFQVLEDTLVGNLIYPYHTSLRQSLSQAPKFYFFDLGVPRAISQTLDGRIVERTSAFGDAFEAFVVLEVLRHNAYSRGNYTVGFFSDGKHEIDLILSRGHQATVAIEIKSTTEVTTEQVEKFSRLADSIQAKQKILLSRDELQREQDGVLCLHWKTGLSRLFSRAETAGN